jgi:hypothetical protein
MTLADRGNMSCALLGMSVDAAQSAKRGIEWEIKRSSRGLWTVVALDNVVNNGTERNIVGCSIGRRSWGLCTRGWVNM